MTERFADLLELTRIGHEGDDVFEAPEHRHGARLFGGHVAALALRAAAATVASNRSAHALHAFYVRAGRSDVPIHLAVDRVRDGRSFSVRQVRVSQHGDEILHMSASFQVPEHEEDWQAAPGLPPVDHPDPEVAPPGRWLEVHPVLGAFEIRFAMDTPPGEEERVYPMWVKARERLPDDPVVHACVMTSICDVWIGATAAGRRPTIPKGSARASLDHSVWLHRAARADEWLLLSVEAVSTIAHRTLGVGSLQSLDGRLLATVAQEVIAKDAGRTS